MNSTNENDSIILQQYFHSITRVKNLRAVESWRGNGRWRTVGIKGEREKRAHRKINRETFP